MVVDDNALVDRAAAHRAGLGWYGKNTLLLLPGLGSWFVLGSVVTDAPLADPAAPRRPGRRLRDLPPLSGRLPDRGPGGPGRARRPPVPGLAGAGARALPRGAPRRARRPHLRLRRLPGGLPAQPAGDAVARRRPPAEAGAGRTVDLLDLLEATDAELLAGTGAGTSPSATPATCAATPWWPWATSATARDPATEAALRRWLATDDPLLAEHARWAARLGSGRARPRRSAGA